MVSITATHAFSLSHGSVGMSYSLHVTYCNCTKIPQVSMATVVHAQVRAERWRAERTSGRVGEQPQENRPTV